MLVTTCGIIALDIFAADLPAVANPGQLLYVPRGIYISVGGHPANVSINLTKLGFPSEKVSLSAAVGHDPAADFVIRTLKKHGIKVHLQKVKDAGTAKDMILVVKGEDRRFHVEVGANLHLNPELVMKTFGREHPLLSYVGGVGMLGDFDEALGKTLECAKKLECITFVDVVTPYQKSWDFLLPAFGNIDLFHCNIEEAKSITGKSNLREATESLINAGVKMAFVTMGEGGGYARSREFEFTFPSFKVRVVDPSGAGDAFCAGAILKIIEKYGASSFEVRDLNFLSVKDWTEILSFGAATGAVCCTAEGTTTAVNRENVEKLLEEQGKKFSVKVKAERVT